MGFTPFSSFTIHTTLNKKAVSDKLARHVAPVITYFVQAKTTDKPFKGTVTEDGFEMMRVVSSRNSFLPFVIGRINSTIDGCDITVKMRLHWSVIAFMVIFLGGTGTLGISLIFSSVKFHHFDWSSLIPFAFFIGLYTFCTVIFQEEASYVKVFISRMLDPKHYKNLPMFEDDWQDTDV